MAISGPATSYRRLRSKFLTDATGVIYEEINVTSSCTFILHMAGLIDFDICFISEVFTAAGLPFVFEPEVTPGLSRNGMKK